MTGLPLSALPSNLQDIVQQAAHLDPLTNRAKPELLPEHPRQADIKAAADIAQDLPAELLEHQERQGCQKDINHGLPARLLINLAPAAIVLDQLELPQADIDPIQQEDHPQVQEVLEVWDDVPLSIA